MINLPTMRGWVLISENKLKTKLTSFFSRGQRNHKRSSKGLYKRTFRRGWKRCNEEMAIELSGGLIVLVLCNHRLIVLLLGCLTWIWHPRNMRMQDFGMSSHQEQPRPPKLSIPLKMEVWMMRTHPQHGQISSIRLEKSHPMFIYLRTWSAILLGEMRWAHATRWCDTTIM